MTIITVTRYHDFSAGHRVVGHEGHCKLLHGHNYRVHFTCQADTLDTVGRVVDFGVIKSKLCEWLEESWDHRFLAWTEDTAIRMICESCMLNDEEAHDTLIRSIVWLPFNPTAENMARFLLTELGPLLYDTGCELVRVVVDETRKCSAAAELPL